ncbi:DEAD-box ATP-dependent RNA helicase CshA [bioreactor metagenome]|uniref:DEAD-box ATP-dependent RNA helicase CshA n=1 Tax=bioreactor metagenome TaxID=1076179 RepID=A0A645FVT7_9ZZZZ
MDELSEALKKRGYSAEGIHGDLTQAKRDSVLRQFRDGIIDILVATDVAARGLDVSGVTHVYNFDIPQDSESYVHRIGRTGRAGQTGAALSFVIPRELDHLRAIERLTKRKIVRMPIPTITDALEGQQKIAVDKLFRIIEEGNFEEYKGRAEEMLTEIDSVALVSAALKLLTKEPDTTPVKLTEEAPLRVRRDRGRPPQQARRKGPGDNNRPSYNKSRPRTRPN